MSGALITLYDSCAEPEKGKPDNLWVQAGWDLQMALLVPAPTEFGVQKDEAWTPLSRGHWVQPVLSGGLGSSLTKIMSLPLGFSGSWNAAGKCSSATTCLNSSYKGKIGSTVLEKGSLAHLREGWREKEFLCFLKTTCSSFEAFSKCNWTSAAPSVAAAGDFTRRELNTFMQDPPICT